MTKGTFIDDVEINWERFRQEMLKSGVNDEEIRPFKPGCRRNQVDDGASDAVLRWEARRSYAHDRDTTKRSHILSTSLPRRAVYGRAKPKAKESQDSTHQKQRGSLAGKHDSRFLLVSMTLSKRGRPWRVSGSGCEPFASRFRDVEPRREREGQRQRGKPRAREEEG